MPFFHNNELKHKRNEETLKNLLAEFEQLKKQTDQLFNDLNICPDQFSKHLENSDNFTQEDWEKLQDHKIKLDQKLDLASHQVDPLKVSKTRTEMRAAQNWLFVR